MDPNTELLHDCSPLFRQYKSGRVERLMGTDTVPPGLDPATGVISRDTVIDPTIPIAARLYLPDTQIKKLPILVYFHGGGFCVASASDPLYQPFLNSVASRARTLIVSVDYRLAPEHPLPAAYDDCWAALKWAFSPDSDRWLTERGDFSRLFMAGDSAGGTICHQMAMRFDKEVKIEGMVLIHAYFWGSEPVGSETRDPELRRWLDLFWRAISSPELGENNDHPLLNPLAKDAPSLKGLGCKRVMVCVGEKDVLAERGRAYCEALKASGWGGEAEIVVSEGEEHVFHLTKPDSDKALELMERIVEFLKNSS